MSRPQDSPPPEATQARDVMAFGQEVGRVLSDGRIVGRAEPYAKVFPSSRAVKRAVGLTAWAVLEDIALDARLDDRGRLVAETNVRRIAANLGIGKNAVSRHLVNLRDYGFVLHEELRDTESGRYEVSRYVLDPSACIERFTHTPAARANGHGESSRGDDGAPLPATSPPCPRNRDMDSPLPPCPRDGDTGHGTVSPSTGHRDGGQKNKRTAAVKDEQQPREDGGSELARRLTAVGIDAAVAQGLVADHPAELVRAALRAMQRRAVRHPAGFVVSALRDGWDLSAELAEERAEEARRRRATEEARAAEQARAESERERACAEGWAAAVSAALDDSDLVAAVRRVTDPVAGTDRRSVPVARAQLLLWAAAAAGRHPGVTLSAALRRDLDVGPHLPEPAPLPDPPAPERTAADLSRRLAACLRDTTFPAPVAARGASR